MFTLTFHLSDRCNLRCVYCYEHEKQSNILKLEDAKKLIDEFIKFKLEQPSLLDGYFNERVRELLEQEEIHLDFIGGEVTLHMSLVEEICDYYFSQCALNKLIDFFISTKIILQSNGTTYFNEDVQHFFNKYGPKIEFPITIDGCKECHDLCRKYVDGKGSFDDVEKTLISYSSKFNTIPDSKLTYTPATFKYLLPSCQYLYEHGYSFVRMNTNVDYKLTKEETEEFYQELIKVSDWILDNKLNFILNFYTFDFKPESPQPYCGMNGTQITIDYNGNLYSCFKFADSSLPNNDFPIGNINTGIDLQKRYDFLEKRKSHTNVLCKSCPIKYACEECPSNNLKVNGDLFKSFNNCGETIAWAKAQQYFLKKAKETNYPYFKEELSKVINEYDPNFKYLLDYESEGIA